MFIEKKKKERKRDFFLKKKKKAFLSTQNNLNSDSSTCMLIINCLRFLNERAFGKLEQNKKENFTLMLANSGSDTKL